MLETVQKICTKLGKPNPFTNNLPGKKWFELFMKRHPKIAKRVSESVNLSKANVSEESLRNWYTLVEEYLAEKDLLNVSSDRYFNTDETGVHFLL